MVTSLAQMWSWYGASDNLVLVQSFVADFFLFHFFQVVPPSFLQEHGGNFEEYVIFRTRTSAKPWIVQVSIFEEPDAVEVRFAGGWEEFAADNRLKPGDSLIFVLEVPLAEFMVYIFRESGTTSSSARNRVNADHFTRVSEQKVRSLSYRRREELQKKARITGDSLVGEKETVVEVIDSVHGSLHLSSNAFLRFLLSLRLLV